MRRLWYCLILSVLFLGRLTAQQPVITPTSSVDAGILTQWLHSDDPRLIAWAADFARQRHDARILAEMPALLERMTMPAAYGGDAAESARRCAILGMLDALIVEKADVPLPAIEAIAPSFPTQAAILIARHPLQEARPTLENWTYGITGGWGGQTLARIASMMLANDPGPSQIAQEGGLTSFVAHIVANAEEELRITVSRNGAMGPVILALNTCVDFAGTPLASGWPQVYAYDLVENDANDLPATVIDLAGDRIAARRFEENRPWGSCYGVRPLDPLNRERLTAFWLGVPEQQMTWQPIVTRAIVWTDQAEYERQLGALTDAERAKLHATVVALRQRGFLTESEAVSVSPRLVVSVKCAISPCPIHQ